MRRGCRRNIARQTGFSLFELLVVMVIIGIAAAFVVPRWGGSTEKLKIRTAVNDLAAVLRFARSQAVTQGQDQAVVFDPQARIVAVGPAIFTSIREEKVKTLQALVAAAKYQYRLNPSLTLTSNETTVAESDPPLRIAYFYSLGNSSGGRIELSDGLHPSRAIAIDAITGTVKIDPS
jgi:type II secretion system protein H